MVLDPVMRREQCEARAAWERERSEPASLDQLVERLRRDNRSSPSPWPECKRCALPMDPVDMHWLFPNLCDSHGGGQLDDLVRRIVRAAGGRRRGLKALKRLAK
jgi:hypothetical protein